MRTINTSDMKIRKVIEKLYDDIFGASLHMKTAKSLVDGVFGIVHSPKLDCASIGDSLAQRIGLSAKHATKQVSRLFGNQKIDVWELLPRLVRRVLASRKEVVVSMDWTEFDGDDQSTLMLSIVTKHGRATPLLWLTVWKHELSDGGRNDVEDTCLRRLAQIMPAETKATILADRGFGDHKLFDFLDENGFAYLIRFRGDIHITAESGERRPAAEWVGKGGRLRILRNVLFAASARAPVKAVVCVREKNMKESWCLATNQGHLSGHTAKKLYARRWTIEPGFRDIKDARFGMGLGEVRIGEPTRRDRLLLANAMATVVLTILGQATEAVGLDMKLKVNTTKRRTHSLFNLGKRMCGMVATMGRHDRKRLLGKFHEILRETSEFLGVYGVV